MDKEIILQASKLALIEVAENFKTEQEGLLCLMEDVIFRLIEKEKAFKRRFAWILPIVLIMQILTVLAVLWL